MWSQSWAFRGRRLSFLVFNLLWLCSLIETSERAEACYAQHFSNYIRHPVCELLVNREFALRRSESFGSYQLQFISELF